MGLFQPQRWKAETLLLAWLSASLRHVRFGSLAERLILQARILRPYTEKFFRAAGLAPGMRVLDVGSGMGDVSLLSADIVGPGGRVLGIDRDVAALDNARRRTDQQGCSSW